MWSNGMSVQMSARYFVSQKDHKLINSVDWQTRPGLPRRRSKMDDNQKIVQMAHLSVTGASEAKDGVEPR